MRSHDPIEIGNRLAELTDNGTAGNATRVAIDLLARRFSGTQAEGVNLAVRALAQVVPDRDVRDLCTAWSDAVLAAAGAGREGSR